MKANELMIGDWVYEGNNHPIQVVRNYGRSIMYKEEYSNEVEETCLNPIPLTEEILKANGWKDADPTLFHGCHYVFICGEKTALTLNHWKDFNTFSICGGDRPLMYVHELQHALRLCGLTELADNFKIKADDN